MKVIQSDLVRAQDEVSASSAGGAPFLIAYGGTLLITGILYFFLPLSTVALIAIFQGSVALPIAFWLERQLGWQTRSADNPLQSLSVQMAMSQVLALPATIIAYILNPAVVPAVLAAVGGGHFLPYAWLHRTRAYAVLAVLVSLGAFALQLLLGASAFPYILFFMALVYAFIAPIVYRNAATLTRGVENNTK